MSTLELSISGDPVLRALSFDGRCIEQRRAVYAHRHAKRLGFRKGRAAPG
jgi:hypothetical protein